MPIFTKICAVLLLMMLVRCPCVAQQICSRLAAMSVNCTEGNSLIKSVHRNRIIQEKGSTFLSIGLQYNRAVTISDSRSLTLEKQYRVGFPLVAGYKIGRCSLEAGGFFGVNATRPQESFWFAAPESSGMDSGRNIHPGISPMMGVSYQFSPKGNLNLRYMHVDELPSGSTLANLQFGWSWNW